MDANSPVPRVVAGVDGSASSIEALRWAVRYAELTGGTVEAVTAWEQPSGWFAPPMEAAFDVESARELQARELHEALGDEDAAKVRTVLMHGNAGDVLLRSAEGAAVLVVGNRGHGGFARAVLGSVSQRVALHADCPVVIVRARKP